MKTLFAAYDCGEEFLVEDMGDGTLEIGVTVGRDHWGTPVEEGDHWCTSLDDESVAELICVLDEWLLKRRADRAALEIAEDHASARD